jgi:hypothetical protein
MLAVASKAPKQYASGTMLAGRHLARLTAAAVLLLSPPLVFVRAQEAPSDSNLQDRKAHVVAGRALLIRIFKEESQLELGCRVPRSFNFLRPILSASGRGASAPSSLEYRGAATPQVSPSGSKVRQQGS